MLIEKIKILHAGSDSKSSIDYYGMVCFRNGKALACDGKTTIIVDTDLDPTLHVCVNADKLYRVCKSFKEDPKYVILENDRLKLCWDTGIFELPTADGSTFPELDKFHIENTYHSGAGVVDAIKRALFCAEEAVENNPICGVNLSPLGVMATNRKEVILVTLDETFKSTFRIDYTAAKLISKQKQDPVKLFTLGNTLGFVFEGFVLMTRALQGDFPEEMLKHPVTVSKEALPYTFPDNMEQVMRVFNSVSTDKEFYVTLYTTADKLMRATLDGDIPAHMNFVEDQVMTMVNSASLRGDRLMLAAKQLNPHSMVIQPNFVQLLSENCTYSIGRVS